MKLLFIGDPHLKISRFDLGLSFLHWVEEVARKEKPDIIVNLGDTFDTHAVLRSEILTEFVEHVKRCQISYFYLLGNHDFYKPNSSKYHALQTIQVSNLTVIDKVTDFPIGITFVPYQPDLKQFPKETQPIVIAHQTFVGADYGYYRPDIGVDADALSAEIIISGHVHKRQMFGKVIYPGTPFASGVSDVNQAKGLMIFDTETYKYSFIESPFPKYRGLKFEVTSEYNISQLNIDIEEMTDNVDHWILDVLGPKSEIVNYLDSKQFADVKKGRSFRIRPTYTDKLQKQVKINAMTPERVIEQYIDIVYDGSLDKGVLKSKALEILTKVTE